MATPRTTGAKKTAARKTAASKAAATRRRKAEATGQDTGPKFFELDYDGEHYVIEAEAANDLELYEHIENEHYLQAIRGFLGDEQWSRFKESQRNESGRVPMEGFEGFLNACMEAINAGNS